MNESSHLKVLTDTELAEVLWGTQDSDLEENFEALKILWERAWIADDDDAALSWVQRMFEVAQKLDSPSKKAYALHHMGMVQHVLNNFDQSLENLYEAEAIYLGEAMYEDQCRVILQTANVLDTVEKYDQKIIELEKARDLAVAEEFVSLAGEACRQIASYLFYDAGSKNEFFEQEDDSAAIEMAHESMQYFSSAGDEGEVAQTKALIGKILNHGSREKEALEYVIAAYDYWVSQPESKNNLDELGETALVLGNIFHDLQEPEEGLRYFQKSLEAFTKLDSKIDICRVHMWLGNLFQLTDRYDEAIDQYRAACQIQQEITDGVEGEWQFFRSTHGIVQSLYYMDKNQEAFDETIKTLSKYGENEIFKASFLSRFLITGASAAYDLENWDEVISMLDLYPEETLLNLNSGDAIRYDGLKSFALLRLGEHQKAFAIANSVIENVKDEELLSTVGMCYEVRAEILESSDPIASRKDYAAAQAIYVDNGHFTKAKKTALKLLPKASERSRISDPATWL